PSEVAVLTETMAVTVGLDRAKQFSAVPSEAFLFDDTVVVLGVGPLGMCFLVKARMLGAGPIVSRWRAGSGPITRSTRGPPAPPSGSPSCATSRTAGARTS